MYVYIRHIYMYNLLKVQQSVKGFGLSTTGPVGTFIQPYTLLSQPVFTHRVRLITDI